MPAGTAVVMSPEDIAEVKTILGEFKGAYEKLNDEVEKLGKADSSTLEKVDRLDSAMIEMRQKYDDASRRADGLETRIAQAKAAMEPPKSFGERVVADAGLVAWMKAGSRGAYAITLQGWRAQEKAISGVSLLAGTGQQLGVVGTGARLPFGVRDLVPQGNTTSGLIEYVRESGFTNAADVVAEMAAKPVSDKTFTPVSAPVRTIAHLFKVSKQSWEDLPGLAALIENNGVYGVKIKEDQQLLNGNGSGAQLTGFNSVASAATGAPVGANIIDAIGMAIFQLASAGYMATGAVVNPVDWGGVALIKNSQGNYIFSNPLAYETPPRVWGIQLAISANQAAGTFVTGDFRGNSLILDREEVNAQVAETNENDFVTNMLTVRVEERLALLIFSAAAFLKGVKPAPSE